MPVQRMSEGSRFLALLGKALTTAPERLIVQPPRLKREHADAD
jgi:hypothetical protein